MLMYVRNHLITTLWSKIMDKVPAFSIPVHTLDQHCDSSLKTVEMMGEAEKGGWSWENGLIA